MSVLRLIAAACVIAFLAFGAGMIQGAADQRARHAAAEARADQAATEANANVNAASAAAASDFSDLQLRTRTEAYDARRDIANAPAPAEGRVGADALVDPALGRAVVCRIERLRGEVSPQCRPAD